MGRLLGLSRYRLDRDVRRRSGPVFQDSAVQSRDLAALVPRAARAWVGTGFSRSSAPGCRSTGCMTATIRPSWAHQAAEAHQAGLGGRQSSGIRMPRQRRQT
jgi:hypothetical protein